MYFNAPIDIIGQEWGNLAKSAYEEACLAYPTKKPENPLERIPEGLGAEFYTTLSERHDQLEKIQEQAHAENPYLWNSLMGYPVAPHGYDAQCLACNQ